MDNGLRKSTDSGKSSLGLERTTQNILSLSRLLNSQCRPEKTQQQRTTSTLTFINDEYIQTFKQFLQRMNDPIAVIPTILEMKSKKPKSDSKLNEVLRICFEAWLVPYVSMYIEQELMFWTVLETKINKLGFLFFKLLERDHQTLADSIVMNNINHLTFIQECYENLLTNILESTALTEFVFRFVVEKEIYFLNTVILLLVSAEDRVLRAKSTPELISILRKYYSKKQEKSVKICLSKIEQDFAHSFTRLSKKINS